MSPNRILSPQKMDETKSLRNQLS